ncbi:Thioredoxin-like [Spirosomataceae bacterium TFI 002]|nr:Thioredoxin-like [Spirosomataceae bacterium TFI 002]
MKNILLVLTIILLTGCWKSTEDQKNEASLNDSDSTGTITIIFNKVDEFVKEIPVTETIKISLNDPVVSYGEFNNLNYFEPQIGLDTLLIKSNQAYVYLNHTIGFNYEHNFVLKTGKTYFIKYDGENPYVDKTDDKTFNNLDFLLNKQYQGLYSNPVSGFFRDLTFSYLVDKKKRVGTLKSSYENAKKNINKEFQLLDSLNTIGQWSTHALEYYTQRNTAKRLKNELDANILIAKDRLRDELNELSIASRYKEQLLKKVCSTYIYSLLKKVNYEDGINRDYSDVFFSIDSSGIFNQTDKRFLLNNIVHLARLNSVNEFTTLEEAFNKIFEKKYDNPSQPIVDKKDKGLDSSDLLLKNELDESFSLNNILKSGNAKLYYVDVWASWCGPCRKEIPKSLELSNKYKDLGVIFLYLSIDDNIKNWKKALISEGMKGNVNSFIAPSFNETLFAKKFKISSIPRYLIFDSKGNLIIDDAIRPSAPKFDELINSLLEN